MTKKILSKLLNEAKDLNIPNRNVMPREEIEKAFAETFAV